jgi:Helicase conserved C-terminal domain
VAAWWGLGSTPSEAKDEDGKTRPALADSDHCVGCLAARQGLLASLAEVPPGRASDRQSLAPAALWARPLVHLVFQDGPEHFATVWREAELLGLICLGALGGMGRALVAGDQKALRRNAVGALPASSDQAVFGTDLTVLVAGAPSARVSALLDSTADRESRGGAVVWRVTPGSVRRALDDGATGPGLLGQLQGIATAATLPQPLRYLIEDAAGPTRTAPCRPRPGCAARTPRCWPRWRWTVRCAGYTFGCWRRRC